MSERKLETKYKFDTRYMYSSGMLVPDHSTFSRLRKNVKLIDRICPKIAA
ncbi:transposase [candidate division KSB1 bacterium]|nr:transposase [candidate division KSB1 bacterium]